MTRSTISPFRRGRWYWARVPQLGKHGVQRALGTADGDVAAAICGFLRVLRDRRESFLLDQLAERKVQIGAAYDAFRENRLEEFIRDVREGRRDEDLGVYVERWQKEMARVRRPRPETREKYLHQLRTLMPEGELYPRSRFTPKAIRGWLAGLDVGATNRYRAAASSFAAYLVAEEVLPFNPVLQVKAQAEAEPRCRYLDQGDAKKVINAIIDPTLRAYHALAACTAMERQALFRLTRRDIDLGARTVLARGTKKAHRARTSHVYTRWSWAWDLFDLWLLGAALLPDARVFAQVKDGDMRQALADACTAVGIADYKPHDWRHTWAVQALRDGLSIQTVSHQLGHRDAVMTLRVYGRFVPVATDFDTRNATLTATQSQPAKLAEAN